MEAVKGLPLNAAYEFGIEHGLKEEIETVRSMKAAWDLTNDLAVRRAYIVDLFQKKNILAEFIQTHWPFGATTPGQKRIDKYSKRKSDYQYFLDTGADATEDVDEDAEDQSFAAESDLRDFLAKNLSCIEQGLKLFQDGQQNGLEYPIDNGLGRIDILAIDSEDRPVVVELKLSRGRNRTIGQLLYYMGWTDKHLGKGMCRGVIIAKEISNDLMLAVQRVSGISLYKYNLSVQVEQVPTKL